MEVKRELGIQIPYLQWLPHPTPLLQSLNCLSVIWKIQGDCLRNLEPKSVFHRRWATPLFPEHQLLAEMRTLCSGLFPRRYASYSCCSERLLPQKLLKRRNIYPRKPTDPLLYTQPRSTICLVFCLLFSLHGLWAGKSQFLQVRGT